MSDFPNNPMNRLITVAYNYHGGGGSPLYRFASCGGVVADETHRDDLIREIEEDITLAAKSPEDVLHGYFLRCLWSHVHVALNPEDWSHSLVEWKTLAPYVGCHWEYNYGILSRMNPGKTGTAPPQNLTIFTPAYVSSQAIQELYGTELTRIVLKNLANKGDERDYEWVEYSETNLPEFCEKNVADRHIPAIGGALGALCAEFSVPCHECGEPIDLAVGEPYGWDGYARAAIFSHPQHILCAVCDEA